MKFQSFMIKYAEIGVKGKNRYLFEDALVRQIRRALKAVEGSFRVLKEDGRIYVAADADYDYEETIDALCRVFGIASICPMVQIDDLGVEDLCAQAVRYMDEMYPDKKITFKVQSRRARKNYPLDSNGINAKLGEVILNAFPDIRVDVHHPELCVHVEVRECCCVWKSASGSTFILRRFRARAECRWVPMEKPCCFCPAESTAR